MKPLKNSEAWPILVFEKAHWGDLWQFARTPAGRELGFEERLKICLEVGRAIADMHSNRELQLFPWSPQCSLTLELVRHHTRRYKARKCPHVEEGGWLAISQSRRFWLPRLFW